MLVVKKGQMVEMEDALEKDFHKQICQIIKQEFREFNNDKIKTDFDLSSLVTRSMKMAKKYNLTTNDSVKAFCILSYLNGENFLETKEFKVHKYQLTKKLYEPNEYIFKVPNKNLSK